MARSKTRSEMDVHKCGGYTTMLNHHLRNKELSLKAVGLLSKMLSLPPDWDYSLKGLAKLNTDGIDGVRKAMRELEAQGYVVRHQCRDENGRMSRNHYDVYEIPQVRKPTPDSPLPEIPSSENPTTAKPIPENPIQINTQQVTTQEKNNSLSNYQSINLDRMDGMEERESYAELIRENIELDILLHDHRFDEDRLREIYEIILDTVCATSPTIRINGQDMPQPVVKSRFLKLDSSHIEYVIQSMNDNPTDIRNIRAYLLTALYNATLTMGNYYSALVNHDLYGSSRKKPTEKTYDYSYEYGPGETL